MEIQKKKKLKSKNESSQKSSFRNTKYQILKGDLEDINFEKTYTKLKTMLALEVNKANYEKLLDLIDSVSENTRVAGNMYVGAKEIYEKYKVDYSIWWAKLSNKATQNLEKMKTQKLISGQVSEEKIKNWIIENNEDEYRKRNEEMLNLRTSVDMMEILHKQWESRKSLLQTQANVIEKRKVVMIQQK